MNRFETSLDHLLAEIKRIDLMLRRQVIKLRLQRNEASWDELRGLYISEEEMDDLLSSAFFSELVAESTPTTDALLTLDRALHQLEIEIAERKDNTLHNGLELRLELLRQTFNLTPFDVDCLLIGLLPELDRRYQRLYAYLQDDVTKKAPTVDLALSLTTPSVTEKSVLRMAFLAEGCLLRHHLMSLYDIPSTNGASLLEKALKVEPRVVNYLLGSDQIDVQLHPFARLVKPQVRLSNILLPSDIEARLHHLIQGNVSQQGAIVYLQGPYGAGKQMIAEALCQKMGTSLLVINVAHMLAADLPVDLALSLIFREASLQRAYLYWDSFESLLADDRNLDSYRYNLLEKSGQECRFVFLGSQVAWEPAGEPINKHFLKVELPVPPFRIRQQLWQFHLDDHISLAPDVDLDALANKFRFTGGQIRDAVATARNLALGQGGDQEQVAMNHLYQACRSQSNQKLNTLARKIQPKFTWEDIVLPKDQMAQLREVTNYVKYRHIVYGDWNFEQKASLGKGLNVLFAGPSGTGKTMAADIMAKELGLDLYKIDLSTVVSKYIGETEKNLDRIFREAQDSNAILFFDEADAIFGKRSEVRDSHDRYANIEIAYLLQKMEEYEGIVILATNLRKNLDEAFARRMHFSIEFPSPEEAERQRIWRRIFPPEAPVAEDVDFGFLARQFKITGGNIKNIALGAAFLAANDGGKINIEHLIKATKREYQKIGRLCTEDDFAPYFDLVKG